MSKLKYLVLVMILGVFFLSGCGGSDTVAVAPYTVEQIRQDMEDKGFTVIRIEGNELSSQESQLTIESIVVKERTTQGRIDDVCCSVIMSNDSYRLEGDYNCRYECTNEGDWRLIHASTENVLIKYIGDSMPIEIEEALNTAYFDDYPIVNTENVRLEDGGIETIFSLNDGKQYFHKVGQIKQSYHPICRSDLNYDAKMQGHDKLTCYWSYAQENTGMEEEWDIVGTYTGSAYDGMYTCELVIDAFDPQQQNIHVAYAKYVSTGRHDDVNEVRDITLSYEVWEGDVMTDYDKQLMFSRSRTELGQLLRIEDDDAFYGSVRIKRTE